MARISHEQIVAEVTEKGFELIDDSQYSNLSSPITVKCCQNPNHIIETTFADVRKPSFICPYCDKQTVTFSEEVPAKNGAYRIIAFDQATENFGLSIFDNGKLVFYHLYSFSGVLINRLVKIKKFLYDVVFKSWEPDFIMFEDIQYQNGVMTFKVLAELRGIVEVAAAEHEIPYECVSPNVWRKYAGTAGKTRREEKMLSIAVVKEKYNIRVDDDVAEAILIGHYGARMHKREVPIGFGKKK